MTELSSTSINSLQPGKSANGLKILEMKEFVAALLSWKERQETKATAEEVCNSIKNCCINKTPWLCLPLYRIREICPLPRHLIKLDVSGSHKLQKLPDNLPPSLIRLDISYCRNFPKGFIGIGRCSL